MASIQCKSCGFNNSPGVRYCTHCGSSLDVSVTPLDEIRELRGLVARIIYRLDALDSNQLKKAPQPPPAPLPETVREEVAPPTAAVEPPYEEKPAGTKEREWEQILGGNWLARIGVLALIIGVGFFLKYAFDNDWIGPTGRVVMGIIGGLGLLGLGYYWRRKYPVLTQVLSGGGIAILYLSIFAAFAVYDLVNIYAALAFLLLVSVTSAVIAVYYNSMALAIIGIIGAFFAPFILGASGDGISSRGGKGQAVQLLLYVVVIDIGVLVLSTLRNWRWFTLLALGCSLIAFGFWYGEFNFRAGLALTEMFITIIFVLFAGATSLFHIVWRRAPKTFDYILMLLNAAAYFGISLGIMWGDLRVWMGGFVLLLAVFYGLLSYAALKQSAQNARLSLFALAVALVFLTVAIPVQLGDKAWTTIVWAFEFVFLMWLSFNLKMPFLRSYSYAIFLALAVRLIFFDTTVNMLTFRPVLNERFLAFAAGIAATYLGACIVRKMREVFPDWRLPTSILFIAASFFSLWILSFEVWQAFSNVIGAASRTDRAGLLDAQNLSLTAVWAIYAVAGIIVGFIKRWRYVRLGALVLFAVPILKVFVYDVFKLEMGYRIGAFVGLGLLLLVSAYLFQRYSKVIKGVLIEK